MVDNEIREITDRLDTLTKIISRISVQLETISKKLDAQTGCISAFDLENSESVANVAESISVQNSDINVQDVQTQPVLDVLQVETVSPVSQTYNVVSGDKKYSNTSSEKKFELSSLTDTIAEDSIYELTITDSAHGVFRLMEESLECLRKKSPAVVKRVCTDEGNYKTCSRIIVESLGKVVFDVEDEKWRVTERCKVKFV